MPTIPAKPRTFINRLKAIISGGSITLESPMTFANPDHAAALAAELGATGGGTVDTTARDAAAAAQSAANSAQSSANTAFSSASAANASAVAAHARANHTGTQDMSTVSGLAAALAAKLGKTDAFFLTTAIGDGETDDTAAIQSDIDALASAGGGTLLFPARTFPFTNLRVRTAGIELRGVGCGTKLLCTSTTEHEIDFHLDDDPSAWPGLANCAVRDMSIVAANARTSGAAIFAKFSHRFGVSNVTLGSPQDTNHFDGIRLECQDTCLVDNVEVGASRYGFYSSGTGSGGSGGFGCFTMNGMARHSWFWGPGPGINGSHGIHLGPWNGGLDLVRCMVAFAEVGIYAEGTEGNMDAGRQYGVSVLACSMDSLGSYGYYFPNIHTLKIEGGWAGTVGESDSAASIYVGTSAQQCSITNFSAQNSAKGIEIAGTINSLMIAGNSIQSDTALMVSGDCGERIITSNIFEGNPNSDDPNPPTTVSITGSALHSVIRDNIGLADSGAGAGAGGGGGGGGGTIVAPSPTTHYAADADGRVALEGVKVSDQCRQVDTLHVWICIDQFNSHNASGWLDLGAYTPFAGGTEVARWNLADTSDSVGGNTLTAHGSVSFAAGLVGDALSVGGSNNYLQNTSLTIDPAVTGNSISLWFNMAAFGSGHTNWIMPANGSLGLGVYINGSTGELSMQYAISGAGIGIVPGVSEWHHLIFTQSSAGEVHCFVDNAEVISETGRHISLWGAPGILLGNSRENGEQFNGMIDNVRIFEGVLNSDQRAALWNGGSGNEDDI